MSRPVRIVIIREEEGWGAGSIDPGFDAFILLGRSWEEIVERLGPALQEFFGEPVEFEVVNLKHLREQ